jgi:hypothetical protein
MDFSFLHAADLHLGSPFLGLSSNDEELARRVAAASREAFEELVDQAICRQVKVRCHCRGHLRWRLERHNHRSFLQPANGPAGERRNSRLQGAWQP